MKRLLLAALGLLFIGGQLTTRPPVWLWPFEPFALPYCLPEALKTSAGAAVTDAGAWERMRRPEVLELFRSQVYGRMPGRPAGMTFQVFDEDRAALGGSAVRKQVRVSFTGEPSGPGMDLLLYLPAHAPRPAPVFLILNFRGNHAVHRDPAIRLTQSWIKQAKGVVDNHAAEEGRGTRAYRFPVEKILARGYGLATIYYGDLDPDFDDGFKNGVHALDGPGPRPPDAWGSIAAWAWGMSRALDYLETDPDVDARRVMTAGHSRLGKTALWAAAEDRRFAGAFASGSGCMGGAIGRRMIGENIADINRRFGYWFCDNFHHYNYRDLALPVDQHLLLALIAPRPVYLASAELDIWSDPYGEFAAARAAAPVFELLGARGDGAGAFPFRFPPPLHSPQMGAIGFHIRAGEHDILEYDWLCFMDFADRRCK